MAAAPASSRKAAAWCGRSRRKSISSTSLRPGTYRQEMGLYSFGPSRVRTEQRRWLASSLGRMRALRPRKTALELLTEIRHKN